MTSRPRCSDGASSEMYLNHHQPSSSDIPSRTHNGVTRLAAPIASPTILLPTTIPHTSDVTACHSAPMTNRTSAMLITAFLPYLSAITPARGLARRANRLVDAVTRLLSSVVSSLRERSVPMETRREETTPVLHPRQLSPLKNLPVDTHS